MRKLKQTTHADDRRPTRHPQGLFTCPEDKRPRHPKNHAHGCGPCILDNLRRGKMPACFFRAVSGDLDDAGDFTIQGFVDFFHRHRDEYKEKFPKQAAGRYRPVPDPRPQRNRPEAGAFTKGRETGAFPA